MRLLISFLFLSIACVGKGDDTCPEYVLDVCEHPLDNYLPFHETFPKSETELEELCLKIKNYAECAIDLYEKCPEAKGFISLQATQSLLETSNSFCKMDSAWFKGVIKYGSCYDNFIGPFDVEAKCSPEILNKFNEVYSNMHNQPYPYQCYYDIQTTACVIEIMTNNCGKMAKEVGLHFLNGVGFENVFCTDVQEEAIKLKEDLKISFTPETTEEEFATLFEDLSASYGSDKDKCLSNYKNLCRKPNDFIYDFPENSADLLTRCNDHKEYRECLIDYQNTCKEKMWGIVSLQEDLETLNTFCDESSVLFKALIKNGKCFNKLYTVFDGEPFDHISNCREEIRKKNNYENEYHRHPDYYIRQCLSDTIDVTCLAEVVANECGSTAKELMLQALKLSKMQYTGCQNYINEAEVFMRELNFSLDPEYSLKHFISLLENETEFD